MSKPKCEAVEKFRCPKNAVPGRPWCADHDHRAGQPKKWKKVLRGK